MVKCISAMDKASFSNNGDPETMSKKICGVIDMIGLLRSQLLIEIADGSADESTTTRTSFAITNALIEELNKLFEIEKTTLPGELFTMVGVDPEFANAGTAAGTAEVYGTNSVINCKKVTGQNKRCSISASTVGIGDFHTGLGYILVYGTGLDGFPIQSEPNFTFNDGESPLEFLCCLRDHFTKFLGYYQRLAVAQKCNRFC